MSGCSNPTCPVCYPYSNQTLQGMSSYQAQQAWQSLQAHQDAQAQASLSTQQYTYYQQDMNAYYQYNSQMPLGNPAHSKMVKQPKFTRYSELMWETQDIQNIIALHNSQIKCELAVSNVGLGRRPISSIFLITFECEADECEFIMKFMEENND